MKHLLWNHTGFTLIEMIAALLVSAFLGAMMFAYFNSALNQSGFSVHRMQRSFELHTAMENITSDYEMIYGQEEHPGWMPLTSYAAGDIIQATIPTGHLYLCIQDGTSGETEPDWPMPDGAEVSDGSVTWMEHKGELDTLLTRLYTIESDGSQNNNNDINRYVYGTYGVVDARYIKFVNNFEVSAEPDGPETLLKIIIRNELGESLTGLFATSY